MKVIYILVGLLLVNPVPVEMLHQFDNGQEVILNPGDKRHGSV